MFTTIIPATVSPGNRDLAKAYAAAAAGNHMQEAAVGLLLRIPAELFANQLMVEHFTVRTFGDDDFGGQPIAVNVLWHSLSADIRSHRGRRNPVLSGCQSALLLAACAIAAPIPVAFHDIAADLHEAGIRLLTQAMHHAVEHRCDGEPFDEAMARVPQLVDATAQKVG